MTVQFTEARETKREAHLVAAVLSAICFAVLVDSHDLVDAHHFVGGRVGVRVILQNIRNESSTHPTVNAACSKVNHTA